MDNQNNKQTLGRDMSWSLLHFKQYVQASLHIDIDLHLQQYPAIEQEGSLYFALLMEELVPSNEQSCEALVSLVHTYNIAINWKDDLIAVIKLLRSAIKSIMTIQTGLKALPFQLWDIALFRDTIQKVSNDAKQVVYLIVLWTVIVNLFLSHL